MSLRKITNSRSLLSTYWVVITADRSRTPHFWEWSQARCLDERSRTRGLFRFFFFLLSIRMNGESQIHMGGHEGRHTPFIWTGSHTYDCIYIQRNGAGATHMTAIIIVWMESVTYIWAVTHTYGQSHVWLHLYSKEWGVTRMTAIIIIWMSVGGRVRGVWLLINMIMNTVTCVTPHSFEYKCNP